MIPAATGSVKWIPPQRPARMAENGSERYRRIDFPFRGVGDETHSVYNCN